MHSETRDRGCSPTKITCKQKGKPRRKACVAVQVARYVIGLVVADAVPNGGGP